MNFLQDQKMYAIKKYMFDILQHKFPEHEHFIERMVGGLVTEKDYESFSKFVAIIYETGYLKAVNDYKGELAKIGLKVSVVPEKIT